MSETQEITQAHEHCLALMRACGIHDQALLKLLEKTDRGLFVPEIDFAYAEYQQPFGEDRNMLDPVSEAKLLQAALAKQAATAVVLGSGFGFTSAILAQANIQVTAIEHDQNCLEHSKNMCSRLGIDNISFVQGDVFKAIEDLEQYDLVFINASLPFVTFGIAQLVADQGRLVGIVGEQEPQQAMVFHKLPNGHWFSTSVFETLQKQLPGARTKKRFVF